MEIRIAPSADRSPRRVRNARAVSDITSLQFRRPLPKTSGLAGGSFPSGRSSREIEDAPAPSTAASSSTPKIITPTRKPLITRQMVDSPAPRSGGAGPQGTMARAPAQLRVTRNAPSAKKNTGPNLRGRNAGGKGGNRTGGARAPKKREGKGGGKKGPDPTRMGEDVTLEHGLSDGMVQHLLRLQRKEWDRVPYEPKYAPGSYAANELIHAGRELFRGEAPPVKVWGRLEQKLNIVGMHGAAAHLQVRRMPEETMTVKSELTQMKQLGISERLPSLSKPVQERAASGSAKVKAKQEGKREVRQKVEA